MLPIRRQIASRGALVCALCFALPLPVPAEENRKIEIHPHLGVVGWYDDNVDFAPHTGRSDYYAQITPGIGLKIPNRIFDLTADYTYIRYQYLKLHELDRDFHQANVEADDQAELIRNVFIRFGDKYEMVPIRITTPADFPNNITQRNTAYIRPTWRMEFSRRNRLALGYEFSRVDYTGSSSVGEDYFGHRFFSEWEYDALSWITLLQQNSYTIYDYDRISPYYRFAPVFGLMLFREQDLTLSGVAGPVYEWIEGDRYRGEVYRFGAEYGPSKKLRIKAIYTRTRNVDIEGVPFTDEFFDLRVSYWLLPRLELIGLGRYHKYLYSGDIWKRLHFKAGVAYNLTENISLNAGYARDQTLEEPGDPIAENRVYAGGSIVFF